MDISLNISNLSKTYGNKNALKDFTFDFNYGIYGILGANGAGKSTLFNLLTDNIKRDNGHILYNGEEILSLGSKYRKDIGYMPQKYGLYEDFSPVSFLMYMAELKGISKNTAKHQIEELLTIVNLDSFAKKKISSFSGGMKQRVHLANALLGEPKVIILDEPTVGLDPYERISFRNLITSLAGERIIIYSTHITSDIESVADNVLFLENGKLIKSGTCFSIISTVKGKVFETICETNELESLKSKYSAYTIKQSERGLLFRIVSETKPEGFIEAVSNISLEDAYLYYSGQARRHTVK